LSNFRGYRLLGITPERIGKLAIKKGIPTILKYFDKSTVNLVLRKFGKCQIATATNVFAHIDNPNQLVKNVFKILKKNGVFICEIHYLPTLIEKNQYDTIYHEHLRYYTLNSLKYLLNRNGVRIFDCEKIITHGGSIRVYVNKGNSAIDSSVSDFIQKEKAFGLTEKETYAKFGNNVETIKKIVNQNIQKLKEKYKIVAAYGSPAKATTSLNYFGINNSYIDYTIEDNELKNGKFIPGVNIPIKNKEHCLNNMPNVIIVLAWNFFELIKENNKNLLDNGVKFINIKELQLENFEP
jgi:hypothetical protein